MPDAQITLKTLAHLQRDGVCSTIAGYQRGFRWTRAEKRFIRMNHPDDILLLSRTQTGSVSREYYSYVLFLKARKRGLPVFYHADYTESSEKYAWFEDSNGARIRILYRNPDGTRWRCLAYREEDSSSVFDGSLEEMLDYIRESSR